MMREENNVCEMEIETMQYMELTHTHTHTHMASKHLYMYGLQDRRLEGTEV